MTCHDARERLSALLDEALAPGERAALDAHLATCAECRHELEALRRTVALVRGVEPARAPAGFMDRVLAAARPEPWARRWARRLFQPWRLKLPLEAAAVLIVGFLAVWSFQRSPEMQRFAQPDALPPASRPAPPSQAPTATPPAVVQAPPGPARAPASPPAARLEAKSETTPPAAATPAEPAAPAPTTSGEARDQAASAEAGRQGRVERQPEAEARVAKEAPAADESRRARVQSTAERGKSAEPSRAVGLVPAAPPSEVAGRLVATDRERAERDLVALVTTHGGTTVWRRGDGRVTLMDVEVPRAAYARFVADLARLGRWTVEREVHQLPETVRIQVQLE